jgi:hypothetical protein
VLVAQSAFEQQLPGTHAKPQQKSDALAAQADEFAVQVAATQAPVVVLQMVPVP